MPSSIQLVAPDRLQIREGGGCMSAFGMPFFLAGVFLILGVLGVIPVSNTSELPAYAWGMLVLMGVAFTAVGGGLTFGRSWTTIDRSGPQVVKQWGLLVPMRERSTTIAAATVVTLGFVQGDSDTADRFPVALKTQAGPDLPLSSFTVYAQARECARAVAEHLRLEFEDASTDHPVRLAASQVDVSFRERQRQGSGLHTEASRPPNPRSEVTRELGEVRIVIPSRPLHAVVLMAAAVPVGVSLLIGPSLATFFRRSQTPDAVGWIFLGFLTLFFGVLPLMTIVNAFLRSRRGATIVTVSTLGLQIQRRGAWTTRTTTSLDPSDILDVDYSSRESTVESARRAAEQEVLRTHGSASPALNPRLERILTALARFAKGKGVTIKTRSGLTTFGEGLDDVEIQYLHGVVRKALLSDF